MRNGLTVMPCKYKQLFYCHVWILLPEYSEGLELIPALIGKCFITCAFAIIYVFTSELFPTSVRSTVLGLCSMWARIGGMLAPFSSELVGAALLYISLQKILLS